MILGPGRKEQVMVVGDEKPEDVFKKVPEVFAEKLAKLKGFKHKIIEKKMAIPTKHKLRGVPFSVREELEEELDKLCKQGIIEPIESSIWLSPLVVARKRDGKLRVCVDLRSLNKEIWVDSHPLPRLEDLFAKIGGAKVFSKLDLAAA
mgnify:CR=1 FL=1